MASLVLPLLIAVFSFAQRSGATCGDSWVYISEHSQGFCRNDRPDSDNACANVCAGSGACGHECTTREGLTGCWCKYEPAEGCAEGEPHYRTFDSGYKYGHHYQGLCKHTLVKQCRKTNSFPTFTLSQVNRPWRPRIFSALDVVYLYVKEWRTTIEVLSDTSVKINGRPVSFPDVQFFKGSYPGFVKTERNGRYLYVTTSFGLRIRRRGINAFYTIPQHTELRGNTCGVLGNFDGDVTNDLVGPDGTPYSSALEFGNSWCETPKGKLSKSQADKIQADIDRAQEACLKDTGRKRNAEELCAPVMQIANSCRFIGSDAYDACVFDVCASQGNERAEIACSSVEAANDRCRSSVPCAMQR